MSDSVLITPMQLGPIIRVLAARTVSRTADELSVVAPEAFAFATEGHAEDTLDEPLGHHDDCQVHRVRNLGDRRIGLDGMDRLGLGVDGKNGAVELIGDQVVEQGEADGVAVPGRPHDGDAPG